MKYDITHYVYYNYSCDVTSEIITHDFGTYKIIGIHYSSLKYLQLEINCFRTPLSVFLLFLRLLDWLLKIEYLV